MRVFKQTLIVMHAGTDSLFRYKVLINFIPTWMEQMEHVDNGFNDIKLQIANTHTHNACSMNQHGITAFLLST